MNRHQNAQYVLELRVVYRLPQLAGLDELEGELEALPAKARTRLEANDVTHCAFPGGGGYGDPLDRPPERVLQDQQDELISETAARDVYGVVINREKHTVDAEATKSQREKIRRSRYYCPVRLMPEEFTGRRRGASSSDV